ncbi:MAG: hypothetical protein ACKVY0_28315 [Prosthecobacter sp.]|uniref:hypothetical protein n=1 Tax=Prosthecobacter sp. TaxID=1965333 RepID=UPI0038FE0445
MKSVRVLLFLAAASFASAADVTPQLGTLGEKLLDETFSSTDVPKGWNANTGTLRVADGALLAAEKSSDMHIGAFRYRLPLQDCAVQIDFKLGDARVINLGFDPAPGELKKKGHLFSVVISKTGWSLIEHNDKANPESKTKTHAKAVTEFDPATTYTLLLECKGDHVVAQITGKEPLKASAPDFHVKKPGLVFRMGGKDGQEVAFDNVRVWALK